MDIFFYSLWLCQIRIQIVTEHPTLHFNVATVLSTEWRRIEDGDGNRVDYTTSKLIR